MENFKPPAQLLKIPKSSSPIWMVNKPTDNLCLVTEPVDPAIVMKKVAYLVRGRVKDSPSCRTMNQELKEKQLSIPKIVSRKVIPICHNLTLEQATNMYPKKATEYLILPLKSFKISSLKRKMTNLMMRGAEAEQDKK